jgi:DNA phosphorothioation system restriction enzyme
MHPDVSFSTLRSLMLNPEYRSDRDHVVDDFYVPCLESSVRYRRAVGYFTSDGLALAAKGLATFLQNDGRAQLIASPALNEEDVSAIERGHLARDEAVERAILRSLSPTASEITRDRLSVLSWLIAEGRLELRIAVRLNETGLLIRGIYHEKIGIFTDAEGSSVAFTGSSNETAGGLINNFESIDAFWSWEDAGGRVKRKIDNFERLWKNVTPGVSILPFPDAAKRRLLEFRSRERPVHDPEETPGRVTRRQEGRGDSGSWPVLPSELELRGYQKDAVRAWFAMRGRGLFKMATGTGKTITALTLITKLGDALRAEKRQLAIVIVCPLRHLVTQWAETCHHFGLRPLLCFESRQRWLGDLDTELLAFRYGTRECLPILTTNSTLASPAFQERLQRLADKTLIIVADEVHNFTASSTQSLLPDAASYRLGLSATPERWYDDEGTEALTSYFGPVVFEYSLQQAITSGALTPYNYFPVLVEMTPDESEEYLRLSREIGTRYHATTDPAQNQALQWFLIQRSRLLASAENKLIVLRELVEPLRGTHHNLFYCGDGQVESGVDDEQIRQLEAVIRLLGLDLGMRVDSYTAETYLSERDELRRAFALGSVQGLVAIRCLDEGVDIPETRRAFILASSTNPKQFVQRRGRVLRRAPGKDVAEIYDFVVVPPEGDSEDTIFNTERRLVKREMERFGEFARLARNSGEATATLLPLLRRFNLLHLA